MEVSERTLLAGYLRRRVESVQQVIDTVPVFSKRYDAAVEEMEELAELLGWDEERSS